jgi:hypothetical protein
MIHISADMPAHIHSHSLALTFLVLPPEIWRPLIQAHWQVRSSGLLVRIDANQVSTVEFRSAAHCPPKPGRNLHSLIFTSLNATFIRTLFCTVAASSQLLDS